MATLSAGHPELEAMWRDAETSKVTVKKGERGTHFRIMSGGETKRPTRTASTKGRWVSTARPITLEVTDDHPDTFELASGEHPAIRVHRLHSESARATVDGGALVVTNTTGGMDAVFFARASSSIEELLVVRDRSAEIAYDLELPRGWTLHQGPLRELIEMRDERDVAQLRMRARAGWDANGHEIEITPRANGSRIRIAFPREAALPVLIDPLWEDTGSMLSARSGHTATLLPNGRILVAGGGGTPDAEIFDPATRAFTAASPMTVKRLGQSATMLRTGKVLLVGGGDVGTADDSVTKTAEVFDSKASSFQPIQSAMAFPHVDGHTATRLADGRVLIAGASALTVPGGGIGDEAEIYDEPTNAFQSAPPMTASWLSGSAARLPSGDVVIVGGDVGSVDAYDALAASVALAGATQRLRIDHTSTVLKDGLIFTAGGGGLGVMQTTELFDPSSGQSIPSADLVTPRADHAATLLPSGAVLVSGGSTDSAEEILLSNGVLLSQIETHMSVPRTNHTSTLLPDGRVFVVGGSATTVGEIFEPRAGRVVPVPCVIPSCQNGDSLLLEESYGPPAGPYRKPVALAQGASFIPLSVWPQGRGLVLDPSTGQTQVVGGPKSNLSPLVGINSVVLGDGQVLMVARYKGASPASVRFDPSTQSFSNAQLLPPVLPVTTGQTLTLLPGGKVLVLGAWASGLIYDPLSDSYSMSGLLPQQTFSEATLLVDGRVLVTGGPATQLYDPLSNSFRLTGAMQTARYNHRATLLSSGKVLITGGLPYKGASGPLGAAELYDPATESFQALPANMAFARSQHAAVLLPSGKVVLGGGEPATVEVFDPDPSPGSFRAAGSLGWPATRADATLLVDGKVLFVGQEPEPGAPGMVATWDWDDAIADSSRPILGAVASPVTAGATTDLTGSRFEGIGEASGGTTNASPTDHPIALWMPIGRGYPTVGTIHSWTPTSANWTVPTPDFPGPGMLFVVANGIRSVGQLVSITPSPLGASCTSGGQCSSGACATGLCCDQACDGPCVACSNAKKGAGADGLCGPVPAGLPSAACPTEDVKLCGHDGLCDANGQCAFYPDGTECGPGESCVNAVCALGNGFACDGDHLLSNKNDPQSDCAPYRCSTVTNRCFLACDSNLECVDGSVCGASGRCEAPLTNGPAASCALPPGEPSAASGFALGIALLGAIGRRRRRRARCRASGHWAQAN